MVGALRSATRRCVHGAGRDRYRDHRRPASNLVPVSAAGAAPRPQSAGGPALSQGALRRESAHTRVDGRRERALERAIALDPRFAAAHAQLGNLYGLLGGYGVMSPRNALPLMREEARKAVAIDPLLPEGHAMLGTVAAWFDFDWPEAERHFRFAMAQGAVPPLVRLNYAMYRLLPTGRAQEAADHYAIALKEDPLNLMARAERAVCSAIGVQGCPGQRGAAPDSRARRDVFLSLLHAWRQSGCGRRHGRGTSTGREGFCACVLVQADGRLACGRTDTDGERRTAPRCCCASTCLSEQGYFDPIGPAVFHNLTGDVDRMADWVEKAIEERQFAVFFFLRSHGQRALRSESAIAGGGQDAEVVRMTRLWL